MPANLELLSILLSCLESISNVNLENACRFIIALGILYIIYVAVRSSLFQEKGSEGGINIIMNNNIYYNGDMDVPEEEFYEVIQRGVRLKKQIKRKINKGKRKLK